MNIVQIGGYAVNKSVTSRGQLLAAAKEIAYAQGLSAVNIRAVAAACGVAVGSLYNYFPTKADLIAAVIEDFWRGAAHRETCAPRPGEAFPDYVGRLYEELRVDLAAFRSDWLRQVSALGAEERQKGRALEERCFTHLKAGLLHALEGDPAAPRSGPAAQREDFVDFVFSNMMALLRAGREDCAYLRQLLEAVLR